MRLKDLLKDYCTCKDCNCLQKIGYNIGNIIILHAQRLQGFIPVFNIVVNTSISRVPLMLLLFSNLQNEQVKEGKKLTICMYQRFTHINISRLITHLPSLYSL